MDSVTPEDDRVDILAAIDLFEQKKYDAATYQLDNILSHQERYSEDSLFDAFALRASLTCMFPAFSAGAHNHLEVSSSSMSSSLLAVAKTQMLIRNYLEAAVIIARRPISGALNSVIMKLEKIVKADPHFMSAWIGLAGAYYLDGKYDESFRTYSDVLQKCADLTPNTVRVGLALCSIKKNQLDHAKLCLERALTINPNEETALMAMSAIELHNRNVAGMMTTIKQLLKVMIEKDNESNNNDADNNNININNDTDKVEICTYQQNWITKHALALHKYADLLYFKALATNQLDKAKSQIRDLITASLEKDKNTVAFLTQKQQKNPTSVAIMAQIKFREAYACFQRGRLLHYDGNLEDAERMYRTAINSLITSTASHAGKEQTMAPKVYLAKVLYQQGREAECARILRSVFFDDKCGDREVLQMLSVRHTVHGNYVKGLYYCNKLVDEYAVSDPQALVLLGFVHRHNTAISTEKYRIAEKMVAESKDLMLDWQSKVSLSTLTKDLDSLMELLVEVFENGEKSGSNDNITVQEKAKTILSDAGKLLSIASSRPELVPLLYNIAIILVERYNDQVAADSSKQQQINNNDDNHNSNDINLLALRSNYLVVAQRVLVTLVKAYPLFMDPYHQLAELYFTQRQYNAGMKWLALSLVATRDDSDGMSLSMIACLYQENSNSRLALEVLRRNDNNITTSLSLGALFLRSALLPSERAPVHLLSAKECFSRVLRVDGGNILAAHGLACCVGLGRENTSNRLQIGASDTTLTYVDSLVCNDNTTVKANINSNTANLLVRALAYKRAITVISKIPQENLTYQQLSILAFCYASEGNYANSLEIIIKAVEKYPKNPILLYNQILLLLSAISNDLGCNESMSMEVGKQVKDRIRQAGKCAMYFLKEMSHGVFISQAAFDECKKNVRRYARKLEDYEIMMMAALKRGAAETRRNTRKGAKWDLEAKKYQEEQENAAQAAAAELEAQKRLRQQQEEDRYRGMVDAIMMGAEAVDQRENDDGGNENNNDAMTLSHNKDSDDALNNAMNIVELLLS